MDEINSRQKISCSGFNLSINSNMNSIAMNYTTPIAFNGKVNFKRTSLFDSRKICDFSVKHPTLKTLHIISTKETRGGNKGKFIISVKDAQNSSLAYEKLILNKSENEIYGCNIKTNERYRNKSLGEILRLASIITMLQNKLKSIKLFSIHEATLFHTKYKFEPNITDVNEAKRILNQIANSGQEEYSESARMLIIKCGYDAESKKQFCKSTNLLAKQFLEHTLANKNYNPKMFDYWTLDMILTEENIIKNKQFFNKLFQKHDIDYRI